MTSAISCCCWAPIQFWDFFDFCFDNFRMFRELLIRLDRSKFFHQAAWLCWIGMDWTKVFFKFLTACVAAILVVRKSSKSEPSSRFFGRLKIFDFRDAHYLLYAITIENCDYLHSVYVPRKQICTYLIVCYFLVWNLNWNWNWDGSWNDLREVQKLSGGLCFCIVVIGEASPPV